MSKINTQHRAALLEAFTQYLYEEDTSRNTTNAYLSDLSQFLNWYSQTFAAFDLAALVPGDIRDYREHLQEQIPPLAPATINRRLAALLLTDLTLSERSGHVQVRRGKGNKSRRVPLNAEARAAIRAYLQVRPSSVGISLLVGQRGEPLSAHAIYNVVVKYARRAGLDDVTTHTLRHSFARTLVVAGTELSDVADLLGHSSLDTTRIYTKASETDLAAVVARLEER